MPTSYSKFTLDDFPVLGISVREGNVFDKATIAPIEPSDSLVKTLDKNRMKKLRSEKAKCEYLITPILSEIEERNSPDLAVFSGYNFDVDKARGLKGFCDYVLSFEAQALNIEAPVFSVVEAKNENLYAGVPQCVAELYAASIFNTRKNKHLPVIYGASTFGLQWKFIRFSDMEAIVDYEIYYINELPKLLGVLQHIVNIQK
jgi:hypothetical protein